jgi:hypothetical protein
VLLDPANGPPSDVDRGNVRLAAISVLDVQSRPVAPRI